MLERKTKELEDLKRELEEARTNLTEAKKRNDRIKAKVEEGESVSKASSFNSGSVDDVEKQALREAVKEQSMELEKEGERGREVCQSLGAVLEHDEMDVDVISTLDREGQHRLSMERIDRIQEGMSDLRNLSEDSISALESKDKECQELQEQNERHIMVTNDLMSKAIEDKSALKEKANCLRGQLVDTRIEKFESQNQLRELGERCNALERENTNLENCITYLRRNLEEMEEKVSDLKERNIVISNRLKKEWDTLLHCKVCVDNILALYGIRETLQDDRAKVVNAME